MATSNLQTYITGDICYQSGNGVPNHSTIIHTIYIDLDTGFHYANTDGGSSWGLHGNKSWIPPQINLGDGSVIGVNVFVNGGGGKYYSFSGGAADDIIAFNWNLNNNGIDYDGSDIAIELEARLSSNGVASDTVGLLLDYAFVTSGDNSTTTVTNVAQQNIDVSSKLQDVNFLTDLATISGASGKTMLLITITRNSTGTSADIYGGNFEMIGVKIKKV